MEIPVSIHFLHCPARTYGTQRQTLGSAQRGRIIGLFLHINVTAKTVSHVPQNHKGHRIVSENICGRCAFVGKKQA